MEILVGAKQLIYFGEKQRNDFVEYSRSKYPEEACGFFVDDRFIPSDNIAEDKINDFKIKTEEYLYYDKIQAIVHSHDSYPHVSKKDMLTQIATAVPWGMLSLQKNLDIQCFVFWGDQLPPQNLVGRQFVYGVYDCFSLCRDYLRHKEIIVPDWPRENFFWANKDKQGNSKEALQEIQIGLDTVYKEAGCIPISKEFLRIGDFLVGKLQSTVLNHCGIYIGNGLVLHHVYGKLSCIEPMYRYDKIFEKYIRYIGKQQIC
jgi:proteasome lid subunit RPN8/RPN11